MKKKEKNMFNDLKVDWDELKKCFIDKKSLEDLSDDDRNYLYIKSATSYISTMNTIELFIREMEKIIKNLVPESIENLKILLARIDDIDPKVIDDLSSDFIDKLFTIEDRKLRITTPEVGKFDSIEFKRALIKEIKLFNKQSESAISVRNEIRERFKQDIPDNIQELIKDVEAMDEWVLDYYRRKVELGSTSKEDKAIFERTIKIIDDSYSLEPIKKDLTKAIEARGKESTLNSFVNNRDKIVLDAINICSRNKLTVPFVKFVGIEELLFGNETNESYKGLFLYLFARYIKNNKEDLTQEKKMFISSLSSHLVLITIHKHDEKIKKTFERIKTSVKELLDILVNDKK